MAGRCLGIDAVCKRLSLLACSIAATFVCFAAPAWADYIVGAGATTMLSASRVDLGCTDMIVSGTLDIDSATFVNVRNVMVLSGGVFHGGSGSLALSGSFTVASDGQFLPEQSTITTNSVCGVAPGTVQTIPTLADEMLITLAAMLACIATLVLRRRGTRRQRSIAKGTER